jgi:hypothetical protein
LCFFAWQVSRPWLVWPVLVDVCSSMHDGRLRMKPLSSPPVLPWLGTSALVVAFSLASPRPCIVLSVLVCRFPASRNWLPLCFARTPAFSWKTQQCKMCTLARRRTFALAMPIVTRAVILGVISGTWIWFSSFVALLSPCISLFSPVSSLFVPSHYCQ